MFDFDKLVPPCPELSELDDSWTVSGRQMTRRTLPGPRRYCLCWFAVLLLASCSVETTGGRSPEEAVTWAGFVDISGLQITASEDVGRLDAASFSQAVEPGIGAFVQKADSVDLTGLVRVRSAEDSWRSPDGATIWRDIIRGEYGGTEVIHVMSFAT